MFLQLKYIFRSLGWNIYILAAYTALSLVARLAVPIIPQSWWHYLIIPLYVLSFIIFFVLIFFIDYRFTDVQKVILLQTPLAGSTLAATRLVSIALITLWVIVPLLSFGLFPPYAQLALVALNLFNCLLYSLALAWTLFMLDVFVERIKAKNKFILIAAVFAGSIYGLYRWGGYVLNQIINISPIRLLETGNVIPAADFLVVPFPQACQITLSLAVILILQYIVIVKVLGSQIDDGT